MDFSYSTIKESRVVRSSDREGKFRLTDCCASQDMAFDIGGMTDIVMHPSLQRHI
jgi:hypothetical protein